MITCRGEGGESGEREGARVWALGIEPPGLAAKTLAALLTNIVAT
jgi:hypothetical protein